MLKILNGLRQLLRKIRNSLENPFGFRKHIRNGIFHLYKPHPSIIEAIEEEKREKEKQLEQEKLSAIEDEKKEN